jgi:hypothetical protein
MPSGIANFYHLASSENRIIAIRLSAVKLTKRSLHGFIVVACKGIQLFNEDAYGLLGCLFAIAASICSSAIG